jgi:NhaP-type Na+/H+ or K+/H+ antiporter
MTGGQIAALIFAILLLLPGGCFLVFGISFPTNLSTGKGSPSPLLLLIAAAILALAGRLFWVAFRRRPDQGGSPDAPPP